MTDIFQLIHTCILTLYLNIDQCSIFLRKFLNLHFNLEILVFSAVIVVSSICSKMPIEELNC